MKPVSCICLLPVGWPWTGHLTSQISVYSPRQKNPATGLGNLDCKWSVGMTIIIGIIPSTLLKKATPGVQNLQLPGEPHLVQVTGAQRWETLQHVPGTTTHLSVSGLLCIHTEWEKLIWEPWASKTKFFERTDTGLLWCERGELSF